MARKKRQRVELNWETPNMGEAFQAALVLFDEWMSPDGPAVVREVQCLTGGRYLITYRLISVWGKEAW